MGRKLGSSKPMRMWIDGKCFNLKQPQRQPKYSTQYAAAAIPAESTHHDFTINPTDNGKLATAFRLPCIYYEKIWQTPNFSLKGLERDTKTIITIPKRGNEGSLIITGDNESDITNARHKIHSIISQVRHRLRALQFISIPVHSEEVQMNFIKFKEEILNVYGTTGGIHESIFQKAIKLHLTVAVFSLMDETEEAEAVNALNDCKNEVIKPLLEETGSLKIKVSGIDCMQENLSKVNVLFAKAKVENGDVLQNLANSISDYFYERGLVQQYQDAVKLHVTLMNTKYRKGSGETTPQGSPQKFPRWGLQKSPFDARPIMEKYKDYHFGEAIFDCVHISYMQSQSDDGFYKPLSVIKV